MTREEKANELAQKYFPDANNIWARANLEAMCAKQACLEMASWVEQNLWKSADGDDDLPELEREVVVFTQNFPNNAGIMKVCIAHRPNPKGWNGRNILTGEVEHFVPKIYGKGGWSMPDVKIWLDCKLPFKEDEI